MTVLEVVKTLLKITDDTQDSILQLYISITEQEIKNYCNRTDIPTALFYVECQMVADLYTENQLSAGDKSPGLIKRVQEGTSTVEYDNTILLSKVSEKVSSKTQLNRYRLLYRL